MLGIWFMYKVNYLAVYQMQCFLIEKENLSTGQNLYSLPCQVFVHLTNALNRGVRGGQTPRTAEDFVFCPVLRKRIQNISFF